MNSNIQKQWFWPQIIQLCFNLLSDFGLISTNDIDKTQFDDFDRKNISNMPQFDGFIHILSVHVTLCV